MGDTLAALKPAGNFFTDLIPDIKRHHLAIAAGSGITPVLSLIATTLEIEQTSRFTLIYGNRGSDSIMFLEALEDLKNRYTGRLRIFHVFSREVQNAELLNGRIDADKIREFCKRQIDAASVDAAFLCGPWGMVQDARKTLIECGTSAANIHTELFGTPDELLAQAEHARKLRADKLRDAADDNSRATCNVRITLDDKTTTINLQRGAESILDAALKTRKGLPFACKGGVCATCKARVIEGEVELDINYALSQEELDQGYILTCQAHPVTDSVAVSFDDK